MTCSFYFSTPLSNGSTLSPFLAVKATLSWKAVQPTNTKLPNFSSTQLVYWYTFCKLKCKKPRPSILSVARIFLSLNIGFWWQPIVSLLCSSLLISWTPPWDLNRVFVFIYSLCRQHYQLIVLSFTLYETCSFNWSNSKSWIWGLLATS